VAHPRRVPTDNWQEYWELVVDTMAEGLFIVDTTGTIVFANKAAARITGYSPQELIGRRCDIFRGEDCQACWDERGRLMCGLFEAGKVENKRCVVVRKDGVGVHVLKNASVLLDPGGRIVGGVETITDISELVAMDRQLRGLRRQLSHAYGFEGLIGTSKPMQRLYEMLAAAATSSAPVLLLGESGTGKELAAAAIHRRSPRAKGPFIKVNCAALNPSLLESELFGHIKGAFTGAEYSRKGRFEAAHTGSIFLDEIGDLPPEVQIKLLRVLQEGEIERVGSHTPIKVDTRVITATNKDLEALMRAGAFREDLYYRINVIPIHLPPLRSRMEDIPLLVDYFIQRIGLRSGKSITGISTAALKKLMDYHWPGNVRELINALEYAFVTCKEGYIQPQHLPPYILGTHPSEAPAQPLDEQAMRNQILNALSRAGGNRTKAAQMLGISRVTLWKRMKRLGLEDYGR